MQFSLFTVVLLVVATAFSVNADSGSISCTCASSITVCPSSPSAGITCTCSGSTATCSGSASGSCSISQSDCDSTCSYICAASSTTMASDACSCSSSSKCFPASATVELENGQTKTMAQLQVQDRVKVDHDTYSDVYMFSHQYALSNNSFVSLTTAASSTPLLLTADHYLYVNGKLATAKTVKVGDVLMTGQGKETSVVSVKTTIAAGLYNPHTLTGDIVVNGIKTSTYTSAISPALAHSALWPVRMAYQLGHDVVGNTFAQGSDVIADMLPNGKDAY